MTLITETRKIEERAIRRLKRDGSNIQSAIRSGVGLGASNEIRGVGS